jgi:hypothetical protein
MLPKATDISKSNDAREREREREREHSRLSALSNFSIGDMFKDIRDGPKSVKFPEKLLKVLEQKLEDIAMGKDRECVAASRPCIGILTPLSIFQVYRPVHTANNGSILWSIQSGELQKADERESQNRGAHPYVRYSRYWGVEEGTDFEWWWMEAGT